MGLQTPKLSTSSQEGACCLCGVATAQSCSCPQSGNPAKAWQGCSEQGCSEYVCQLSILVYKILWDFFIFFWTLSLFSFATQTPHASPEHCQQSLLSVGQTGACSSAPLDTAALVDWVTCEQAFLRSHVLAGSGATHVLQALIGLLQSS